MVAPVPGYDNRVGRMGSDSVVLSSGMFRGLLPPIPNLEAGFDYCFGNRIQTGRGTIDYVVPLNLRAFGTIFGEAHAEFQTFWRKAPDGNADRTDLSLGGGYRKIVGRSVLVGVNGFYDTSRLSGSWYSSGGVGLEMAAIVAGEAAFDLNVNYYGNLFSRDIFINAFRNVHGSFDVDAGYSQPIFDRALDLRLSMAGYQYDIGSKIYGWRGGVELTNPGGTLTVRYEQGEDRINGSYSIIGALVNVGFQVEQLLRGQNPFSMPEPVFRSPRNLDRLLVQKVRRNWHQPSQVLTKPVGRGGEAHFELTINPPYWCDGSDCSSGVVETQSASQATWRIRFTHQTGDDWCGASGGYVVRLVGDTSRLVFPLIVTITPSDWASWIDQFTVRQDYVDFLPETTIMANSTDLVKNIPPDGSGVVVDGEHPRIHRNLFTGTQVGFQGRFTISAPGVTPLTVDIVSTN